MELLDLAVKMRKFDGLRRKSWDNAGVIDWNAEQYKLGFRAFLAWVNEHYANYVTVPERVDKETVRRGFEMYKRGVNEDTYNEFGLGGVYDAVAAVKTGWSDARFLFLHDFDFCKITSKFGGVVYN